MKNLSRLAFFSALVIALVGCEGEQGSAGVSGPQGRIGETGATGATGANGANGADGADGVDGADGADGANGRDGADAICAGAEALSITSLGGFPEELIEGSTEGPITVESNVSDARQLRLSFAGSLAGVSFVDNEDGSFNIVTVAGSATDQSALFSLVATDGCTTDTISFSIDGIGSGASKFTFVNLIDGQAIDLWASKGEEVVGLAADGAASYSLPLGYVTIAPGQYEFTAFVSNAIAESPADYDPSAFIASIPTIDIGKRENHVVFLYQDADGVATSTHIVNEETAPADGSFATNVGHFAGPVGQVDILNIDTDTAVLEDVDFGVTSGRVELPAGDYNFGVDVDNDGVADVVFETITAPAGVITNLFASISDGAVVLGLLVIGADAPSLAVFVEPVPVLANDGAGVATVDDDLTDGVDPIIINAFPYPADGSFIGYESASTLLGGVATRRVVVPGAANLQVVVEIDTEPSYDFFQAANAAGELIANQDGVDTLSLSVVGDTIDLGVNSDPSVSSFDSGLSGNTYQGYRILGVSFE